MTDWYVPVDGQIPTFPDLSLPDDILDRDEATYDHPDGGAPTIYSNYLLSVSGAAPEDVVVARLEAALSACGWSLFVVGDHELRLGMCTANPPVAPVALQVLRNAEELDDAAKDLVSRLSLHRLAFVGMTAKEGHAGTVRQAVAMPLITLPRRPEKTLPSGRRPVVALLDSGIGRHDWLTADSADPIWLDAADVGWDAPRVPPERADLADADPRTRSHAGHGTFNAGLIRQLAPDARLLSLRIMRADGIMDEQSVLSALGWLVERVKVAVAQPERFAECFVDVVCLAFGYYEQIPADSVHTVRLRRLLGELGNLGVRVVASAGNHKSDTPVFPAALTALARPDTVPETELISVGALNPDLSRADYSNFGDWVRLWTVGTALVSAVPMPVFDHLRPLRESPTAYEPDNLASGFALWGGTSFAAAVIAGQLAALVTEDDDARATCDSARGRARRALDRLL
jgi:hypothetical protein